ncbi:MAG: hypothetical protein WC551_03305 [Patescibacteria group bacterium]
METSKTYLPNIRTATSAVCALGFILALTLPNQARAEVLFFQDEENFSPEAAVAIRHPNLDQRRFGRLNSKDEVAYYSITAEKDTKIELELDTLKADGDFNPTLVFFGPGLAAPKEDPVITLGEGNGAIISRADGRTTYFDRSVFTSFTTGPRLKIALPEKATFGVAIRTPNGRTGRYALRLKGKDDFKWSELTARLAAEFRAIFRMY